MLSDFKLLMAGLNDDYIIAITVVIVSTATIIVTASKVFCF